MVLPMASNLTFTDIERTENNITLPGKSTNSSDISTVVRLTITTCVFVLTLVGNTVAIFFVSRKKELLGLKNYYYGYYLINLSISDILVAILCIPFTVIYYESQHWPFGALMCKLLPTLQIAAVTTSIGTLVVITFDRYKAILHPMKPRASAAGIKIKLCCVWIWAFCVGAPSLYANQYNPNLSRYQCREVWTRHQYRQIYTIIILLFDYLLPLLLICVFYTRIVLRLKSTISMSCTDETKVLHRRFLRSTAFLVTSFAICYLPAKVCFLVMDFGRVQSQDSFTMVLNYSHVLIWFNSCLNPFIYGTVHGFFKTTIKRNISLFFTSLQDTQVSEALKKSKLLGSPFKHQDISTLKEDDFKKAPESIV